MTEILVADVNLNSVCERLEQHCCVDQNQHNLSSQPQTPVLKRHSNTGAKLWGRVRSKLLKQKVSDSLTHITSYSDPICCVSFISSLLLPISSAPSLPSVSFITTVSLYHVCSVSSPWSVLQL